MSDGEARDRVIGRLRTQYEQLNGKQPTGKVAQAIERQASQSLERVANRQVRWTPSQGRR